MSKTVWLCMFLFLVSRLVIWWADQPRDPIAVEKITDPVVEFPVRDMTIRKKYLFPIHIDDFVWDGKRGQLTSPYGERNPDEIGGLGDWYHDGLDLWGVSNVGTWHARIVAVSDGVVINHWLNHPFYGKMIEILHDDGYVSRYAHLSTSYVHEKQLILNEWLPWRVKQGEVIGRQGNTGLSKGRFVYKEHLHFELRINGKSVNPLRYIDVPIPSYE